jgi:hypothetical protein
MAPAARKRGGGVIALLLQGDPPHYGAKPGATSAGPGRRIVLRTGKPSADSRARPEPRPGRQYSITDRKVADCHRSPFSPPLPATVTIGLSTYSLPITRRPRLLAVVVEWRPYFPFLRPVSVGSHHRIIDRGFYRHYRRVCSELPHASATCHHDRMCPIRWTLRGLRVAWMASLAWIRAGFCLRRPPGRAAPARTRRGPPFSPGIGHSDARCGVPGKEGSGGE